MWWIIIVCYVVSCIITYFSIKYVHKLVFTNIDPNFMDIFDVFIPIINILVAIMAIIAIINNKHSANKFFGLK